MREYQPSAPSKRYPYVGPRDRRVSAFWKARSHGVAALLRGVSNYSERRGSGTVVM